LELLELAASFGLSREDLPPQRFLRLAAQDSATDLRD
jgi:hypothetical protein